MRPIDADAMMLRVNCHGTNKFGILHDVDIREFINEQPTVDAVPVVWCKDCVHKKCVNDSNGEGLEYCGLMFCIITDNFYCRHGERKDERDEVHRM